MNAEHCAVPHNHGSPEVVQSTTHNYIQIEVMVTRGVEKASSIINYSFEWVSGNYSLKQWAWRPALHLLAPGLVGQYK